MLCRAAIAVWRSSSRSRAARYWEYVPLYSTSVPVPSSDSRSMWTTRVIASSSRSRSWLTTSSPPRYAAQELEQPGAGVGVEVVGGLVEEEQVTAAEEDAHELDASPLTAGEGTEGDVEPVRRAGRRPPRACAPPPRRRTRRQTRTAPRAAPKRSMLRLEGSSSIATRNFSSRAWSSSSPRPESTWAMTVVSSGTASRTGVLGEVPGGAATADDPGPGRRGAAEHPQERGLPGAVATHQADLVARSHLQGGTVDDPLAPDLDHQVLHGQHGESSRGIGGRGADHCRARGPFPRPVA